ncbi:MULTISPECIES: tRNA (adenosine(37)-N6)-threonylcarbamoyltransferase complex dimerization subunit type 1 TsaB [unclassified Halomonas]|mgnify:CR=1 FL=1|uniref:tRNA threonylcarbamoyladenosine biosynthesis protein TsaB n=1 Tax=Halomonas sp. H10-59 TaxID=2950874 RepID=A0AAU7KRN2_9GAMM|nr:MULTISPECIES: tRNA (adenosine(37)-N6)-threonylcarbamoyltransferase complex dimerization subunit type 1 TsaB [unclassified Halomonas]MBR9770624.1 tRNA (adenosine(37)-N6)-threonylcarbamoyltransferase complex dimerization subunit type 1 TsaB [Gammaproteobacteria bacterium]KJZ14405.1 peptidase M22 [Halomonas sp. S2151]MAR71496.1 tRNA (adenosine(37)-N6)-threonylcarbamoyltransferase complex dimerization subunit type 1 TsaB [Halomonas sp.]MBR9879434.1 tRNA (adenosine(37)-N6)-threonylcarbamoyltransf
MTLIVALDASSSACSAALLRRQEGSPDEVIARFAQTPREHTRRLLPMVDEVLAEAGVAASELDAVAYGRGPGSFTGLRIAAGVAQGLAYGLDRPLVGVSTLEALALGGHLRHRYRYMVTALDARMGEIYVGAWRVEDGRPLALMDEAVLPPERLVLPREHEDHDWVGLGSGWALWDQMPAEIQASLNLTVTDVDPAAEDMVRLAVEVFAAGDAQRPHDAQPVYLRDQVAWKKTERKARS